MARKLKSDKLLFTATLLLVCTSVVMVYSASAVIAMENHGDPYLYLFKQGTWALLGVALVPVMMRIDYRNYRQPVVIWAGLALVSIALVAVLFGHALDLVQRLDTVRRGFRVAHAAAIAEERDQVRHLVFRGNGNAASQAGDDLLVIGLHVQPIGDRPARA